MDFLLITGRTTQQAAGMHRGKTSAPYLDAIARVEMNPADMADLAFADGDAAQVRNTLGYAPVSARVFEADIPRGMVFMPMGPVANRLIPGETRGTGMPAYKDQRVEVFRP